jgi:hypothetical protein
MKLLEKEKFNILKADEGKTLYSINEEVEEIDYFTEAYIPKILH